MISYGITILYRCKSHWHFGIRRSDRRGGEGGGGGGGVRGGGGGRQCSKLWVKNGKDSGNTEDTKNTVVTNLSQKKFDQNVTEYNNWTYI